MRRFGTIFVTALLVGIFWFFYAKILSAPVGADGQVRSAGDKVVVDPKTGQPVVVAESVVVGPSGLAIPVAGVNGNQLVDTFTQARAGGARVHDAIDIMAPNGTPVVTAAPGMVEKLYYSDGGGGVSAYIRSDDKRWIYYYAHLDSYSPGLAEGQRLPRGALVGFVGSTGNASPDGPHLHFAIHRMGSGEDWHEGTPVNPYPLLAGAPAKR
jgi:murein DD-endopeptidase MepM/ murein hydrolase activator NlpD